MYILFFITISNSEKSSYKYYVRIKDLSDLSCRQNNNYLQSLVVCLITIVCLIYFAPEKIKG